MDAKLEYALIALLFVANWYLAQIVIYYCAKNNKLWTLIKEGHVIAIMRNGVFYKMKMRFAGHDFSNEMSKGEDSLEIYDIVSTPDEGVISDTLSNILFPAKGVAWVGFPPWNTIYHEEIRWTDDRFEERKEDISQFLVQKYVYGITLPRLELQGGIPYETRFLVTLHFTNPAKAYFRVKRVIDTSLERITGWARTEMSALSIDDFVAPTGGKDSQPQIQPSDKLKEAIKVILNQINDELSDEFGVGSSSFLVSKIDPSDEKMRNVIVAKEIARNEGEAKEIASIKEAAALKALDFVASNLHPNTMQLKAYEAIGRADSISLVGSNVNSLISVGTTQASAPRPALALEPVDEAKT